MDKLLPCPFCGKEAVRLNSHPSMVKCGTPLCPASLGWVPAKTWNARHTPDGWKLVPTHRPTIDMTEAGMDHVMSGQDFERAQDCWVAMLAAAPKWGGE